jgi:hypothetical protein
MSETMEPPKKRRFWQLHLSTAVVMTFVAGGAIWPSTSPRGEYILHYGWPWTACTWYGNPEVKDFYATALPPIHFDYDIKLDKVALLKDLLCVVGMTLFVAFVSEWLIRHREGRKP